MSYGFKTIAANGVPLFNTDGNNIFIKSIDTFDLSSINKKFINFPNYGPLGDSYYKSVYNPDLAERSCIEPYYMLSLPVGAKLYDQWGENDSNPTQATGNINIVPSHPTSSFPFYGSYSSSAVRLSLSGAGSVKIASLHAIKDLTEFGNSEINQPLQSNKGFGLNIYDRNGQLQWNDQIKVGKFDTILKGFQGVSWGSSTLTIPIFASRSLKPGEDFYISLKPLGMSFGYITQTVSATRISDTQYNITRETITSTYWLALRQGGWDNSFGFNLDIASAIF